jgi:hypothetical protein
MLVDNVINHLNHHVYSLLDKPIHIQEAIQSLVKTLDLGLGKKLRSSTYLASMDCGTGKTLTLSCFLFNYKKNDFVPGEGVLIIIRNLEDALQIIKSSGLDEEDYVIFTPDKKFKDKGLGSEAVDKANILFITQSMLKKRLAKKRFATADEFFFRGRPRALRVCDEGILPAEPISINSDRLLGLVGPIRPFDEAYAERVLALHHHVRAAKEGSIISVSSALRKLPTGFKDDAATSKMPLTEGQRSDVQALSMAGGRKLIVKDAKRFGRALVGRGPSLPDDLAPLIVMDASIRVRSLYQVWAHDRGNVEFLPAASNSYDNLVINVWKRASGRGILATPADRGDILRKVADLINAKAAEGWIVICPLDNGLSGVIIQSELNALLKEPDNVDFVTWGRHVGTNTFKDRRNVVVIGAFRQPESVYQARYMAASGKPIESFIGNEWKEIWAQEMAEALMQAISRGNVRNARRGVCGACTVHMVISASPDPIAMLADAFPGATIQPWYPELPKLTGQALALLRVIEQRQNDGYLMTAKSRLAELTGNLSASRLGQLLAQDNLKAHLNDLGVLVENKSIKFTSRLADAA